MSDNLDLLRKALENARKSYYRGNHSQTRYWARIALNLNPNLEEPWLWLAAVSAPRASVAYLEKALSINPKSQRARQGMHWAVRRVREQARLQPHKPIRYKSTTASTIPVAASRPVTRKATRIYWWILTLGLLVVITSALVSPALGFSFNSFFSSPELQMAAQTGIAKASNTPTPSYTPTITPSPTPTNTPTSTPTNTPTSTPTNTPTATSTPLPTDTPIPMPIPTRYEPPPYESGGRWIDVDLSDQMTYAYEGDQMVAAFLVSTGTWLHPTVTGQFYIYVKYEYADMAGPGYYLPDVPYVMYFYEGYGLHGTYWHSNFGTPMSHGCINLTIPDSEWLFYWADIGTLVNIHE
jgi:lipoprotein-anchoring transpeptidase ErfK/SrfK